MKWTFFSGWWDKLYFLSFFFPPPLWIWCNQGNDGNMCEYGYLVIAPEFNLLSLGLLFVAFNIKETEFLSCCYYILLLELSLPEWYICMAFLHKYFQNMPLMIIHENVNELDCLCMSMQKVVHFLLDSFVTTRSYNHIANYLITHLRFRSAHVRGPFLTSWRQAHWDHEKSLKP